MCTFNDSEAISFQLRKQIEKRWLRGERVKNIYVSPYAMSSLFNEFKYFPSMGNINDNSITFRINGVRNDVKIYRRDLLKDEFIIEYENSSYR